ncbi:MFS transporter [Buchnera aphidicola]|uniref:MFS transporter n=1 Tax=Buchnera aphidicola (Artemisaphis artemisicola) TaxID=1241836 RepID=A0A4D6XI27_9GAMM|nr:MFS transporter [Buchnera aphidicola]QCI16122.1 MFS transporter [Buchnera aphidicola (Artemisaphis artemisicola)]
MNFLELQVTLSFCVVFLLRTLGMFMLLPVLSKYGILLDGANNFLIGLSIGIYGIAQVIFQIPFGILSDKFNRKKIILIALIILFIGNILAASIHSIWGLIIGRFFQGAAAISGVCMACLSDLIKEKNYVKSISAIGVSFAFSFLISIITGPLIVQYFGFFSIFWISSFLSIISIMIVYFIIPSSNKNTLIKNNINLSNNKKLKLIFNKMFLRSYLGIFFLHSLLMINFMIIPSQLEMSDFSFDNHWKIYFYTIFISFLILFLFIFYCKSKFILCNIIEICIFFILCSAVVLLKSKNNFLFLILALQIFFIGFNFLEIFLPSYLNKTSSGNYKGNVMSVYSTSQFLGVFFGGIMSGWLSSFLNMSQICLFEIVIISIWLTFSFFCKK